jgi:group I intron endonuclease
MIVYLTTNLINGKKYVGMDSNNNPNYLGSGTLILKAIKKYGQENFKKEILEECSNIKDLETKETFWIKKFNALKNPNFYNLEDNRKRGTNPFQNKSKEEKEKIFNKIKSEERNKKIGKANSKPKPEGFGEKISKINKGRKRSEESKKKQSESLKGRKSPNTKACVVYDKNMNYINVYKSLKQASEDLNLDPQQVSRVIRGKLKTTGGYIIKKI